MNSGRSIFRDLLEQVEIATPLVLNEDGKISEGIAHGTGPQLAPNEIM